MIFTCMFTSTDTTRSTRVTFQLSVQTHKPLVRVLGLALEFKSRAKVLSLAPDFKSLSLVRSS